MIGERIRYFRKLQGLTQEQLSQGICSVSHLSKIENGYENPSIYIIEDLCKKLNISSEELASDHVIASVNEQLKQWYTYLCNRDKEKATNMLATIQDNIEHVHCPEVQLKYKLFLLRYKVLMRKLQDASCLMKEIDQHQEKIHGELKYYYCLFYGFYFYIKEDYTKALQLFVQAEKISVRSANHDPEIYYVLALVNMNLYRTYYSIEYAEKASELYVKECNYVRTIECQILLGINMINIFNFTQASHHLTNALDAAQLLNNRELIGTIYHNLGYLYLSQNDYEQAIDNYNKCMEYNDHSLYERDVRTYYCLAKAYFELEDYTSASDWIQKGYQLAQENELTQFVLHFKVLKSQVNEQSLSSLEDIIKNEVLPYFEEKRFWYFVATYAEMLAENYAKQFKYKNSSHYFSFVNESRKKIYSHMS